MSVDVSARNLAVNAVGAVALRLALHTGDPGTGAANELSGGGYARQAIAFDAASGGVAAMSDPSSFNVLAVTVRWASLWSADGLTRYGKALLSPEAVFPVAGILTINAADLDFSA